MELRCIALKFVWPDARTLLAARGASGVSTLVTGDMLCIYDCHERLFADSRKPITICLGRCSASLSFNGLHASN